MCEGRGEKRLFRCAPSFMDEDTHQAMTAYRNHQQGILPGPGAWSEQTAVFARVLRIISGERSVLQQEESRRQAARARAKK